MFGMTTGRITHVLFDFFGTLVDYVPSGPSAAPQCVALIRSFGGADSFDEADFSATWEANYAVFEARAQATSREFSMSELARSYLASTLGRDPTTAECRALASAYVAEWNAGVAYPPATPDVIAALADRFTLAVVSNTYEPDLVPRHIEAMGIAARFATVVTSVEFGWRKPHPAIYAEALGRLGIGPEQAVFVGDTYDADFAGPQAHGILSFLIDPAEKYDIPSEQRLASLADLSSRLT